MLKKRLRWMLGIALAFVVAAPFLPWQALAQKAGVKREPQAVLRIYQTVNTALGEKEALTPYGYRRFRRTMTALLTSQSVVEAAVHDPKIAHLKLDVDQLREKIVVDDVPDSEIITVKIREMNAEDAKLVLRAVVESFMNKNIEGNRRNKLERLSTLRKLWDAYQTTLKSKRESLRLAMLNHIKPDIQELERKIAGQRMVSDSLEIDKLELSKVGLATKLERLKALKRVDDEDRKTLRRTEDEAAVVLAQMTLLQKRIAAATEILSKTKADSSAIDLTQEQDEIHLTTETAKKVGTEIEAIEVELQAPSPVQVVELPQ